MEMTTAYSLPKNIKDFVLQKPSYIRSLAKRHVNIIWGDSLTFGKQLFSRMGRHKTDFFILKP